MAKKEAAPLVVLTTLCLLTAGGGDGGGGGGGVNAFVISNVPRPFSTAARRVVNPVTSPTTSTVVADALRYSWEGRRRDLQWHRGAATMMVSCGATGFPEPGPAWLVDERDACGVGFIANPRGKAEHKVVQHGLTALGCMEHRGACLADNV